MRVVAKFYTEAEAMAYIESNRLDDAIVNKNIFDGRYEVVLP